MLFVSYRRECMLYAFMVMQMIAINQEIDKTDVDLINLLFNTFL